MNALVPLALVLFAAGREDATAPKPDDLAAYRNMTQSAGKDPATQVRLALWCEAHGMSAERVKHLARAILLDPSNALARGLMGLVSRNGKWQKPEDVSRKINEDPALKALRENYFQRRAQTPDRADDQWKLAQWCDENGLKEEAVAHYYAVLRLDPHRDSAWRHLGFKKVKGRWVKPDQEAAAKQEAEEQHRADRYWKPLLERMRSGLSSRERRRRERAEADFARVNDPRAVPMIWAVFVTRGAAEQPLAVRVLGQIDSPGASRALATLAMFSKLGEARSRAIELLRRRDARDFAPALVAMIRDPIQYEVKPVQGPGKSGELVIHDGTVKRQRIYTPLNEPNFVLGPNDRLIIDPNTGLPAVSRMLGYIIPSQPLGGFYAGSLPTQFFFGSTPSAGSISSVLQKAGVPAAQSQNLGQRVAANAQSSLQLARAETNPAMGGNGLDLAPAEYLEIPIGQMELDAIRSAQVARMQMEGDVRAIDAYNAPIRERNRLARQVLSRTVGIDHGDNHSAWMKWVVDLFGYAMLAQKSDSRATTIIEQVPLAYQPQAVPTLQEGLALAPELNIGHGACFAAGTPVRTLEGSRPIETLRPGDLVLTQDATSGELQYRAVVIAYHNPPNSTYRIGLKTGEAIVATGIHRLWKAGKGWTMARDLKPGDVLRTLSGIAPIQSVDPDRVQPVFNLKVSDGNSYFVGEGSVLAHDNSPVEPVAEPFDAVRPIDVVTAPTTPTPAASPKPATSVHHRSMLGH